MQIALCHTELSLELGQTIMIINADADAAAATTPWPL